MRRKKSKNTTNTTTTTNTNNNNNTTTTTTINNNNKPILKTNLRRKSNNISTNHTSIITNPQPNKTPSLSPPLFHNHSQHNLISLPHPSPIFSLFLSLFFISPTNNTLFFFFIFLPCNHTIIEIIGRKRGSFCPFGIFFPPPIGVACVCWWCMFHINRHQCDSKKSNNNKKRETCDKKNKWFFLVEGGGGLPNIF